MKKDIEERNARKRSDKYAEEDIWRHANEMPRTTLICVEPWM